MIRLFKIFKKLFDYEYKEMKRFKEIAEEYSGKIPSFDIVNENKSKIYLKESLLFAFVIVGFEYIFQYFLD